MAILERKDVPVEHTWNKEAVYPTWKEWQVEFEEAKSDLKKLTEYQGTLGRGPERLAEWFEQFMLDYTGMFREAGINNMYFDRRVRDDTLIQMKNYHHVRSVLYYVRTERVSIEAVSPIRRVNLNVDVSTLKHGTVDTLNIDHDFYETVVDKWVNKSN